MHTQTTTPEVLTAMAVEIHQVMKDKGFWPAEGRDIEECLMLIVTELSEAVEAHRKGRWADVDKYDELSALDWSVDLRKKSFEIWIKDTPQDELADAVIRILDLGEHFGITSHVVHDRLLTDFDGAHTFAAKVYRLVKDLPDWSVSYCANFRFRSELASTFNGIFALSESMQIDLLWHMREKMAYNKTQERLHGKKY